MPPPRPDLDELYQAHAFCRAVARWSRISTYGDPVGWIRRVAWNLAASDLRRRQRTRAIVHRLGAPAVSEPTPDHVVLVQALGTLPPAQRRVVIMFYLADMSLAHIAEFENVSENAVKQRLHRGRVTLTAALTETRPGVGHA